MLYCTWIVRRKKFVIFQIFFFFILCLIKIHGISNFVPDKKFMEFEIKEFMKNLEKKYFIFIFSLYVFIFNYSIFRFLYLSKDQMK